jgi:hypothetical protein
MEDAQEQGKISGMQKRLANLLPHQYKKGQSGNPGGRPVGSVSMKTYVKNKLLSMTEEEREEYLEGIDKRVIWEMAESKPSQGIGQADDLEKLQFNIIKYDESNNNTLPVQPEGLSTGVTQSTTEIQDFSTS